MLHLNEGSIQGTQVLKKEHFQTIVSPSFDTPWGDQIGLSWFLQSYLDRPIIMHTGYDTGFEAIMYIYPEHDIFIAVLANQDFARTARLINAASEIIFDQELKDYTISAKYPFAEAYQKGGIELATSKWETLQKDTTDIYIADKDDLLTTGAILENGKQWQASKEILEYYLTFNNQSTYAWRLLGNDYLMLGDTAQAKRCYQRTLDINPNYTKGRIALDKLQ
jgi:tetratricopeptide (TPR) repeat protein